jgi:NAD/NADP transhydrogenase alpha subunit
VNSREERASITAFVAIVAIALVLVAGMAYDGGQVITAHTVARNNAEQAARAGAQQIDLDHLRATNEPRLDSIAAESAAVDFLERAGATGTATVSGASITVTVTRTQPMLILPGSDRTMIVSETASAVDEGQP